MDKTTISEMLSNSYSNLRTADVLDSRKYLGERGYEVERMLGCGSFGAVMLGHNIFNHRKVAIKLIYIENEKQLYSFTQEFKIMKRLESPYTVRLLDLLSDLDNNYFFLVMDLAENGNLDTFISNNPNINDTQIITMFIEILKGLIFLKDNKIIHGDLKPENILLSSTNSPKLADFGLSSQLVGSRLKLTNKGGSMQYESPEQHLEQQSQIESDWYAAGLILFKLCGNHNVSQMLHIKFGIFPDISKLNCQNITRIAFKMLETSPKNRASPEQVIIDLQKILKLLPSPLSMIQQQDQSPTSKITILQNKKQEIKDFSFLGIDVQTQNLLKTAKLSIDMFDPDYNKTWDQRTSKTGQRGSLQYYHHTTPIPQFYNFPYGYLGLGLRVLDRYGEDQRWIRADTQPETWIVLYYGVDFSNLKDIIDQNKINPGYRNYYGGSKCRITGTIIKEGKSQNTYLSDDVKVVEPFSISLNEQDNVPYSLVLQCRVNPTKVKSPENRPEYYTVENPLDDIRPYRLLIKQLDY